MKGIVDHCGIFGKAPQAIFQAGVFFCDPFSPMTRASRSALPARLSWGLVSTRIDTAPPTKTMELSCVQTYCRDHFCKKQANWGHFFLHPDKIQISPGSFRGPKARWPLPGQAYLIRVSGMVWLMILHSLVEFPPLTNFYRVGMISRGLLRLTRRCKHMLTDQQFPDFFRK